MIAEYNQKRIFVIVRLSFSSMDSRQTTDSLSSCSEEEKVGGSGFAAIK